MRRTIETILPTLKALNESSSSGQDDDASCNVMIHGFYFESEGVSRRAFISYCFFVHNDVQELTLIHFPLKVPYT